MSGASQCFEKYQSEDITMPESVPEDILTQKDVSENIMTLWDVPEEISTPEGVSDYVNIRKKWFKSRGRGCSRWYQDLSNRWILKRL